MIAIPLALTKIHLPWYNNRVVSRNDSLLMSKIKNVFIMFIYTQLM